MKVIKFGAIGLVSVSLLLLGACSNNDKAANSKTTAAAKTEEKPKDPTKHTHTSQVVQVAKYHIDLRPDPDGEFIHLDTKIHDLQDRPIIDAKIVAQVQLPDNTNQTIQVKYNVEEKQYTGKLTASKALGDYKVVLLTNARGDKFNSRFSFKK
jgi:major membrane immunogen (membrane-anchored lipoprotein)